MPGTEDMMTEGDPSKIEINTLGRKTAS